MIKGVVAIVGRPNVGKSTIFNRMIGERLSIVDDMPGVTRDRLYGKCTWLTKEFRVIDTGGIELEDKPFQEQIRAQAEIAMEEADVIVYVADGNLGVSGDDKYIVRLLRKTKKPVILAVNKIDDGHLLNNIYEFYGLGLGEPIAVSGVHGVGMGDLLDRIIQELPDPKMEEAEDVIKFCCIGRPNVGKSSLVNAILKQERVIVSNIEGTTRDAVDTPFIREDRNYVAIDTAGLKKRGKIYEAIDKYAALRALSAIDRSDIVLLVLDASTGVHEQDKHVIGYAIEAAKSIVIVVNKWDAIEKDQHTMAEFTKKLKEDFKFIDYAPIVYVSAKNGSRLDTIFAEIDNAYINYNQRIQTSILNEVITDAVKHNPPKEFNGGVLKVYYGSQVSTRPPMFVLSVNNPSYMHFSYERYLENQFRRAFGFEGTPILIKAKPKN